MLQNMTWVGYLGQSMSDTEEWPWNFRPLKTTPALFGELQVFKEGANSRKNKDGEIPYPVALNRFPVSPSRLMPPQL